MCRMRANALSIDIGAARCMLVASTQTESDK